MLRFIFAALSISFIAGFAGFAALAQTFADEPAIKVEVLNASIDRSLPYLAERGQWWIDKKECMSCHRVSFTAWSHIEAKAAGADVDDGQINEWIDWCHGNLFSEFPEKDQKYPGEKTIVRNLSGAAQMLAVARQWNSTKAQQVAQQKIVDALEAGQLRDGRWVPRGQLPFQKRKLDETTHVITMWNALALHNASQLSHLDAKKIKPMVESADRFCMSYEDGKSSEWLALRGLFEFSMGRTKNAHSFLERLRDKQNDDGGWGWIEGDESDALATAQVAYVLQEIRSLKPAPSDNDEDESSIQRAMRYLVETQPKDGKWKVKGTKEKAKDKIQETASYWGTSWAVIVLSRESQFRSSKKDGKH
ncbi:MAG: hypothetical protein AAFN77_06325 [Planctomycetota bacterium]